MFIFLTTVLCTLSTVKVLFLGNCVPYKINKGGGLQANVTIKFFWASLPSIFQTNIFGRSQRAVSSTIIQNSAF